MGHSTVTAVATTILLALQVGNAFAALYTDLQQFPVGTKYDFIVIGGMISFAMHGC